jgi:hypothetical protein
MFELTRPCFHKQNNCVKRKNCPFFPPSFRKVIFHNQTGTKTNPLSLSLSLSLSDSAVMVAFQITFCAEIHVNDFFLFLKNHF